MNFPPTCNRVLQNWYPLLPPSFVNTHEQGVSKVVVVAWKNICYHHFLSVITSLSSDSLGIPVTFCLSFVTPWNRQNRLKAIGCMVMTRTVGMLIGNRYGWYLDYSLTEKFWSSRILAGLSSVRKRHPQKTLASDSSLKNLIRIPNPFLTYG